jgi:hypothetical protein
MWLEKSFSDKDAATKPSWIDTQGHFPALPMRDYDLRTIYQAFIQLKTVWSNHDRKNLSQPTLQ